MSYIASWSGGKDGCFAVYQAIKQGYKISRLMNFITEKSRRISFHGTDPGLVVLQSRRIGIPLVQKETGENSYEQEFKETVTGLIPDGVEGMVFGDIFVKEHKDWVEKVCADMKIKALEPLWNRNTEDILTEFINLGFKSILVCGKADIIDKKWIGKAIDMEFMGDLKKKGIDVCGENGEYHSLVIDGPLFQKPIKLLESRVIGRDNYWFLDILKYE
jgi:diphthine-ammonia ligase